MAQGLSGWSRANIARAARFLGVGGVATLTYWVGLLVLLHAAHLDPTLSSMLAYLAGIATSFAGHRFFTYRSSAAIHAEAGRFLVTYALCFCAGNAVFWLAASVLKWNAVIAGLLLTGCNIVLSYLAAELWIFRPRRAPSQDKQEP